MKTIEQKDVINLYRKSIKENKYDNPTDFIFELNNLFNKTFNTLDSKLKFVSLFPMNVCFDYVLLPNVDKHLAVEFVISNIEELIEQRCWANRDNTIVGDMISSLNKDNFDDNPGDYSNRPIISEIRYQLAYLHKVIKKLFRG